MQQNKNNIFLFIKKKGKEFCVYTGYIFFAIVYLLIHTYSEEKSHGIPIAPSTLTQMVYMKRFVA